MPGLAPDARTLLLRLGVGQFNATQMIPILFMGPAQTDADMPPVILLVETFQRNLNEMGAELPVTGRMTAPTILELVKVTGRGWPRMRWYEIAQALLSAKEGGFTLTPGITDATPMRHPQPVGALPDPFPMPGGIFGWAALGALVYWYFTGKNPVSSVVKKIGGHARPAHRRTTQRSS